MYRLNRGPSVHKDHKVAFNKVAMAAQFVTPETFDSLIARGLREQQAGNWKDALSSFLQAARQDPSRAPVYLLIGNCFSRMDDWAGAKENYQRAIATDPGYADAYNNLGLALQATGCDHEAIAAHAKAAEIDPNHANAHFNLGKMCARFNEFPAAMAMFEKALAVEPEHAYALHELGSVEERCGLLEKAAASYRRSLKLDPTRTVRENLAAVLTQMGDPEGIAMQEQLVREHPDEAEPHWNLGMGLLQHGRYAEGWREFEWRIDIPRFRNTHHTFAKPRWTGERLDGKTILLYGEQGHGDTLQFLRYLPLVAERGGRIALVVPPLLRGLLSGLPHVAACVGLADPKPEFDTYASLMSLPHILEHYRIPPPLTLKIPESGPVNPASTAKLNVGLAWAGSPKQKRDHLRSIPLALWNRLSAVEGVDFTALQMGRPNPNAGNAGHTFHFVCDCVDFEDFAELAAVVAKLDLVIAVDTAVAHLAGSLGKPVWILLSNTMDWRWGLQGTSTDWYPNARLFRQTAPADWTQVMADVEDALKRLAAL